MIVTHISESKSESRVAPVEVGIIADDGFAFPEQPAELPAPIQKRRAEVAWRLLPSLGIQPTDLAVAFELADAIREQRVKFKKAFGRCQSDFSGQSIHEVRVHCRRLMARLALVKVAIPGSSLDSIIRSLKRLLKTLGELRDVQVQKRGLTFELRQHPEVVGLWIELGRKEVDLSRAAAQRTRRFKMGKLNRCLQNLEAELTDPAARLAAKATLRAAVVRALGEAYAEVRRRQQSVRIADPSSLHEVRKAYKQFRYMVESLPPSVARPFPAQLSAMGNYQTAMGKIQDVEVLHGLVVDYAGRFPKVAAKLERFRGVLLKRRRALIDEYLSMAESLYSFWPLPAALREDVVPGSRQLSSAV